MDEHEEAVAPGVPVERFVVTERETPGVVFEEDRVADAESQERGVERRFLFGAAAAGSEKHMAHGGLVRRES
jgi:hypothetical protein